MASLNSITFPEHEVSGAFDRAPAAVQQFMDDGELGALVSEIATAHDLSKESRHSLALLFRNAALQLITPAQLVEGVTSISDADTSSAVVSKFQEAFRPLLGKKPLAAPTPSEPVKPIDTSHLLPAHEEKPARFPKEPIQLDLDAAVPASAVSKIVPVPRPAAPIPSAPTAPPAVIPRLRTMVSDVEAMGPKTKEAPLHHAPLAPVKKREEVLPKPVPAAAAPGTAPKEYGADPYREPIT